MSAKNAGSTDLRPVVVLAGGGTGGHVFPMVAVADALRSEADVRVVYVGTPRGIESRVVPSRGDELELLDVLPIKGRGPLGAVRGAMRAASTLPRAHALLRHLAPGVVLAVGGYAAGPLGLAAWLARVPLAILEPNSVLGLSNRWLTPFARRAYVAFPSIEAKLGPRIARRTGVPLRGAFGALPYAPEPGRLRLLVLGGSQGAKALNDIVPRAIASVRDRLPTVTILHQAGRDQDAAVREAYGAAGLADIAIVTPFLDDVAGEIARADLIIERAGGSSLAELCAIGRPSILVPFPFAADDHQRKNAEALAASGASVCIDPSDATPERVATEVLRLADDAERRRSMADAARVLGRPDAARDVARDLLALAGIPVRSNPTPSGGTDDPSRDPRKATGRAARRSATSREVAHV